MKVAEPLLAALVVSLAAFVVMQSGASAPRAGDEAAGTIATSSGAADRSGDPGDADAMSAAGGVTERRSGGLATGRAEGRLASASRFVRDVPREAPLDAAALKRRLIQGGAGTYIGALLDARDSVVTRWPDRLVTPLRIWVGDGGDQDGWNPLFPSVVREAFEEWSATGIPVRFTYVRDSASADVHVRFVPQFEQGISGRTIWSRDSEWWLVGGEVELALKHPKGGAVTTPQLRAIALHEVGHLLGLDHVDDQQHIMAPRVRVRTLSDADIATIRLVYSVPAGSARDDE